MPADVQTPVAESSPAAESSVSFPKGEARDTFMKTGKLPASKPEASPASEEKKSEPSSAESAPAQASEAQSAENSAPASEAGKPNQEKDPQKRANAEDRKAQLNAEIRELLKSRDGLKQEIETLSQKKSAPADSQPAKAETPELKAPVKPKQDDFKTWEEYEAARDKYFEELSDYKSKKAVAEDRIAREQEAGRKEMQGRLEEARKRYPDVDTVITPVAQTIFSDSKIDPAVKAIVNQSPVFVDLLYVMGGNQADFSEFVNLAKTNPGFAIRKAILLEDLVMKELSKKTAEPVRDESGKFTKQAEGKAPEKKISDAPPPPKEVPSGSPPTDEEAEAVKTGNMRAFMASANARDPRMRKGQ